MALCTIALGREQLVYVKEETTPGTYNQPVATDCIIISGTGKVNQTANFVPDSQIRNSRSRRLPIFAGRNPGTWTFPVFMKPAAAGTEPEATVLLDIGLGSKTVNAGTSVVYRPLSGCPQRSFSLVFQIGHTVFQCVGCTVNQIEFNQSGNEIGNIVFSGEFMNMVIADSQTSGYVPSSCPEKGSPVHSRFGSVIIGGTTNAYIVSSKITVSNTYKYFTELKNNLNYPNTFLAVGFREVSGTVSVLFRAADRTAWDDSINQVLKGIIIPSGNVAGKIVQVQIPLAQWTNVEVAGDQEQIQTLAYTAIASSSLDDELVVTYQ